VRSKKNERPTFACSAAPGNRLRGETMPMDFERNNGAATDNRWHAREARAVEEEIKRHEESVNEALRKRTREAVTTETAFHNICRGEESPHCPNCGGVIEAPSQFEQWGIRNETVRRLAEFCAQDGLEPWHVMRNLYIVFAHLSLPAWSELSVEEKSGILGDCHDSEHFRKKLCSENVGRFWKRRFRAAKS
jgi:hypothetical protein